MFEDALEKITITSRVRMLDENGKPATNEYGDPVYTTSSIDAWGLFASTIGSESTEAGDQTISQPHVYFTGTDAAKVRPVVDSDSVLTVRGVPGYEVDGVVGDWGDAGLDVPLKNIRG